MTCSFRSIAHRFGFCTDPVEQYCSTFLTHRLPFLQSSQLRDDVEESSFPRNREQSFESIFGEPRGSLAILGSRS